MSLAIRPESAADRVAIREVTRAAFVNAAHASHTEHLIVDALRQAGALSLSLVAETTDNIIGHVAVSPVTITDGAAGWFGLGPVSVLPAHQGHGVGSLLVQEALTILRQRAAAGCVVLGEPSFYSRFGFMCAADLVLPGVPAEYFQAICVHGALPRGEIRYHDAFNVSGE
jgi:putative acetyltransferase